MPTVAAFAIDPTPSTIVQKMIGAIIILISSTNASPMGFRPDGELGGGEPDGDAGEHGDDHRDVEVVRGVDPPPGLRARGLRLERHCRPCLPWSVIAGGRRIGVSPKDAAADAAASGCVHTVRGARVDPRVPRLIDEQRCEVRQMRWIRGWSIAAKLFALQLVVIVVARRDRRRLDLGRRPRRRRARRRREDARRRARRSRSTRSCDDALATDDPTAELQPYAVDVMRRGRRRLHHDHGARPHPLHARRPRRRSASEFLGNIDRALAGDAFTETYTGTLGPSVRAVVPIEDAGGEVDRARLGGHHGLEHAGRPRRPHRHGDRGGRRDDRARRARRVAPQPLPAPRHVGPRRRGDEPHVRLLRGRAALDRRGPRAAGPLERGRARQRPRRRAARAATRDRRTITDGAMPLASLDLPPAVADVLGRTDAAVDEIAITPTHVLVSTAT